MCIVGDILKQRDYFILNVSYINESVSSGELIRQWYLDVKVNDSSGSNINQANVSAWNVTSNISFSTLTDSSGNIATQVLTQYHNVSGNTIYATNYEINVTKLGYINASQSTALIGNTQLMFTLDSSSV